jgi:hypothetical protein
MAVMCLLLLPSSDPLLCLLGVILSVLSSVCPDVLGTRSEQTILSLTERKEEVRCSAQSSAITEMPNPPLVEEETPLFLKHVNV